MSEERRDADARRLARATWPVERHCLNDDPTDDLSVLTTPDERIAMMTELSESAWRVAGRPLPSYARGDIPGRWFKPGEARPDEE